LARKDKSMEQKAIDFIREQSLVSAGDKVVVAVSGGPDSVCLLHILVRHQAELGVQLHVAHLNHQLRGAESDADSAYVLELAKKLGVPATVECRDVAGYHSGKGGSLEEAAREMRYGFLAEVLARVGASGVAVGHTRDDHVETILLHILRGSGTAGLSGLRPCSVLNYGNHGALLEVIRPLLGITREETLGYCRQHRLAARADLSNESPSFLRNRIRLELLPVLRSYNANIEEALLRLAKIAGDETLLMEQQASVVWQKVARAKSDVFYLDIDKMRVLPHAIQRHIFRKAVKQLRGDLRDIEEGHIEAMMEFLSKPAGKSLCLPEGLTLSTEYGRLVLAPARAEMCPLPVLRDTFKINVPGETDLPGWRIKAEVIADSTGSDNGFSASFDLEKAGNKLTVRQRRPGDRFHPLGMKQSKKLQDFMVDVKIPRAWRDRVPVVSTGEQILWVVGWRIDDRVKVTEKTKKILRLQFERSI
jgi:tRNA(Ile)-lysidine synthase